MSTHRPQRSYGPHCLASIRSFVIVFGLALTCFVPTGIALGAPSDRLPQSGSGLAHQEVSSLGSLGAASVDGTSQNPSKTETPPPSEEDPEVDEIDPLTGGLDHLLIHWLKSLLQVRI